MNILFYPRLALSGMRRDRRIYAPYLAACVFMTAVVYDLAFLADSPALYAIGSGVNGMGTSAIRLVMTLGKWVMAVFALLFFFYTNAFLIRRRKKELGLMSVLGMDRGALTSLLFWETAFSALVSLTAGLALGVLLTQLSARVLSHFARTELPALPLLDLGAVRFCVLTDAFIFFLLLLNAWRQVRRASAVSLLRSDSLGERPPRSQWLLVLPGLGLLGGAYYLAVTITEPITAMLVFFVAVVMVILATFLLFIAGSVTLCRTLQGNDRFYYQKKNFVALSSLVYRMKRSGAGLAVICILSTIKADMFQVGDFVDVTGTSKGHGYEGVVKRCGFAIQRKSHGGGPVHRHVGSRGSGTDPSRIFKGTGGPGQMGGETVTIQNLEVVKVDPELNMLVVRGAIPGPKFSLVTVKNTVKTHKVKQAGAGISSNPQKASGRNPQKASARTK